MFKDILNDFVKLKSLQKLLAYQGNIEYRYKYLNSVFINSLYQKETIDVYCTFLYNFYKKVLTTHLCSFFYYFIQFKKHKK